MLQRLLHAAAQGVRQGGGAQCAGGESPFECRALDLVEAASDAPVGKEVAQRVAVAGFTRSAGQPGEEVSGGERAVTAWMAVEAHQRATGPKELHRIEGASHVDLYDKREYIDPAVDKLADFFAGHLGAASRPTAPVPGS